MPRASSSLPESTELARACSELDWVTRRRDRLDRDQPPGTAADRLREEMDAQISVEMDAAIGVVLATPIATIEDVQTLAFSLALLAPDRAGMDAEAAMGHDGEGLLTAKLIKGLLGLTPALTWRGSPASRTHPNLGDPR